MDYFFIGEAELVTGFRFVGIDGVSASSAESALAAFKQITEGAESTRVLILTEEVADWLGAALIDWELSDSYPLIVEIPGLHGRLPGKKTLVDSIREAIGVHI
ncbi:V-type ATP synthase subunit F [Breznakiellaceae bacterium SP9]